MKKQNTQNEDLQRSLSLRAKRSNLDCHVASAPRNDRLYESGNVLWFILIAIILLGLLTAMMTRSGGSTNDTGDFEQNSIAIDEMMSYARSIENAVQSLMSSGCGENEISFWHDSNGDGAETSADNNRNNQSPSDGSCYVFKPEGAGLTWQDPPIGLSGYPEYVIIRAEVGEIGTFEEGSDKDIDVIFALVDLNENACRAINRKFNIAEVGGTVPEDNGDIVDGSFPQNYRGNFSGAYNGIDGLANDCIGGQGPNREYCGEKTACFKEEDSNEYFVFYHVLMAR